jgi:hypothetical protein
VSKDEVEAYAWYNLSALSFEKTRDLRDILEKKLSSSEVQAGQKRSKELQALIEKNDAAAGTKELQAIIEKNKAAAGTK